MRELAEPFHKRGRERPHFHEAYEALAAAAHESGPLDERTRRLVKLAIAVGARMEGAVRPLSACRPRWRRGPG
jgi:alkylhydroperoxidase/carboxymuconolactone decarboxylase family protein YurZ